MSSKCSLNFNNLLNPELLNRISPVSHGVLGAVLLVSLNTMCKEGFQGVARDFVRFLRKLPLVDGILAKILDGEVRDAVKMLSGGSTSASAPVIPIPPNGLSSSEIMAIMDKIHNRELDAENGKAFAYTYTTTTDMGDLAKCLGSAYAKFSESTNADSPDHDRIVSDVWSTFMHTNALNPMMYPSLRKFETEIISMTSWMLHGDDNCCGALTSGGTESILMAVKAYRDRARKLRPYVKTPNMVVPTTIHPAFEKAGHYFGVELIHVALDDNMRVRMDLVKKAINRNTILLVGSAPQYCHGVVDPISDLSDLALSRGLPLHVDACFGGFMLPWLEKLGYAIPTFDFRVPGVTSISADVHKYGYSSKGASIILYRDEELRSHQYFAYGSWPGGLFGSPSLTGSRPGGMIAAAWAALVAMGQDGYKRIASDVMETTLEVVKAVQRIDGLKLMAVPDMTCVAFTTEGSLNIHAVADSMEKKGWKMERQQLPDCIHMSMLPQHKRVIKELISDLEKSVKEVIANPALGKEGSTGMYGMVAAIPDRGIVDDFIVKFFGQIYTTQDTSILDSK